MSTKPAPKRVTNLTPSEDLPGAGNDFPIISVAEAPDSNVKKNLLPPELLNQLSTTSNVSTASLPAIQKIQRKLNGNWYGKCNLFWPLSNINPIWDNETVIFPWLKMGDVVLVTGYNRNCGFIEKLGQSLQNKGDFLGIKNPYMQPALIGGVLDKRELQSPLPVGCIVLVSNISLDLMLSENKNDFIDIVRNFKIAKKILICSFKEDYEFLREMRCWDSVIEIRRSKKINNPTEQYNISNVCFLRSRHLPPNEMRVKYRLITHVHRDRSGYDAEKDIYFINNNVSGYEDIKDRVSQLFKLGRTSNEIAMILAEEDGIMISLPLLNKLKIEWGLRSYKLESKPRKPKKTKKN